MLAFVLIFQTITAVIGITKARIISIAMQTMAEFGTISDAYMIPPPKKAI